MPTTRTEDGTTIITPLVHLNGSSAQTLLEGYRVAWDAVQAAVLATAATAPHGRDYYAQSTQDQSMPMKQAEEEHKKRMKALTSVLEQLDLLAKDVHKQWEKRTPGSHKQWENPGPRHGSRKAKE